MLVLLAALALCVIPTTTSSSIATDEEVISLLYRYAESQNTRNATLAASLFAYDGVAYLPSGSQAIVGTQNIYNAFNGLFSSMVYLEER
jgi:hypothetical protein